MKKIRNMIVIAAIVSITFAGCSTDHQTVDDSKEILEDKPAVAFTFEELKTNLNTEREAQILAPYSDMANKYGAFDTEMEEDFDDEEVKRNTTIVHYVFKLPIEDVLADVDELMRTIRTSYAGYYYFGGDEKFDAAEARIKERVTEMYENGPASTDYLYHILKEEFAFVEDSNFGIGREDTNFDKKRVYFDCERRDYLTDEHGYYTMINDEKWYLDEADIPYLHLTVNENGDLVYGQFRFAENPEQLPEELPLHSAAGETHPFETTWTVTQAGKRSYEFKQIHNLYEKDGIPVTTLGRMSLGFHDLRMTNEFINEAKELKDEDVFILDLRDNTGGIPEVMDFFLYNLMGDRCEGKFQTVKRYSTLNKYNDEVLKNTDVRSDFSVIDFYQENQKLVDSWIEEQETCADVADGVTVISNNNAVWHERKGTIVVLVDERTEQTAESFLYRLTTVENVVIVGSNTFGRFVTSDLNDLSAVYLQKAGLAIEYGQTLVLSDKTDGFDTDGWTPDVMTRGDALEAAIAMIKKGK